MFTVTALTMRWSMLLPYSSSILVAFEKNPWRYKGILIRGAVRPTHTWT